MALTALSLVCGGGAVERGCYARKVNGLAHSRKCAYAQAAGTAGVILALSTRPRSIQCAGYLAGVTVVSRLVFGLVQRLVHVTLTDFSAGQSVVIDAYGPSSTVLSGDAASAHFSVMGH